MKRALVIAGIVVGLGWLLWPQDRDGIVAGEWSGKTTQGLWVRMTIEQAPEGLRISRFGLGLELSCAKTDRVKRVGFVTTFPMPIHDRAFKRHAAGGFVYLDASGVFTTPRSVEGVISIALPDLVGEAFDTLDAEACKVGALAFTAHPGAGDESHPAPDLEIVVDRDGRARLAGAQ